MYPFDVFDLNRVAAVLESLEESIIFRLLDRAQFAENRPAYLLGGGGFPSRGDKSLFQIRLAMQEQMDSVFGRFLVPEERPFTDDLPIPERTPPKAESAFKIGDFNVINQNFDLLQSYRLMLVDLCPSGDDGHYGSSVEQDVFCLQAIARRVHFGALYISESKFRADPSRYQKLVEDKDYEGVLGALTRQDVEARILERLKNKIDSVQSQVNTKIRRLVDPIVLVDFYRDHIINLTKKGELSYLILRCEGR